jgi:heme oxygenase
MTALLEQLRERTRASHHRLERRLLSPPGLSERDRYARYLQRLLGIWRWLRVATAVDAELSRCVPDLSARLDKLTPLSQDLRDLGHDDALQSAFIPPTSGGPAALLGALYVMEGSQLGGPALVRQLAASGLQVPVRYLTCYGDELADKWRGFCAALERFATTESRRAGVCDGALHMFQAVENDLEGARLLGVSRSNANQRESGS